MIGLKSFMMRREKKNQMTHVSLEMYVTSRTPYFWWENIFCLFKLLETDIEWLLTKIQVTKTIQNINIHESLASYCSRLCVLYID